MASQKSNPKRWYMVMFLCLIVSYLVFLSAAINGYPPETTYAVALMIAIWAPILGIFGLRAELVPPKT